MIDMNEIEKFSIYDKITGVPSAHCSSIIKLSNGDMICVFYAGQYEKSPDVKIYLSRLNKDYQFFGTEAKWTKPQVIAYTPNHSSGNPVLYETPSKRLYLFWQSMHNGNIIKGGWSVCSIKFQWSEDFGYNWTSWQYLRRLWGYVLRCRPIITKNGKFILPVHREFFNYICRFYISNDKELKSIPILHGKIESKQTGLLEPCILEYNDHLICFMRSNKIKKIHISYSFDDGLNWSKPESLNLPNPNSQIDAIKLKNNDILMAFNNQEHGRTNLSIAISNDGGKTWPIIKTILEDKYKIREYHYPSLLDTSDKIIHLTYTDNRERIGYLRFSLDWIYS